MATPMSWDFIPLFHLVKGVFEPSDRGLLSQHRHQQMNRVAPVQPLLGCSFSQDRRTCLVHREIVQVCDCALDGLFQFVSRWGGVRTPSLFSKVSCSALSVPWSILRVRAAVVPAFSALSVCSSRSKGFRDTLASSWSLLRHYFLCSACHRYSPTSLLVSQSRNAVETQPWLCQGSWVFPESSHRRISSSTAIHLKVPVSRKSFIVHLGS